MSSDTNLAQNSIVQFISPQLFDEKLKTEKQYWLRKLAGKLLIAGLPIDFVRSQASASERENVLLQLDEQLSTRLLQVSGGNESLAFAILVAALKICLHKYTGVEDIVIGTTIHNRYGAVASLNKVLALRDEVSASKTVKQLMMDVKRTLSEAYANQKYAFQRIVELLEVETSAGRQALFNVGVTLENINDAAHLEELKTDLNLIFSIQDQKITCRIDYAGTLFARKTVEVFAGHFLGILQAALQNPDETIGKLSLLTQQKRHDLVVAANDTSFRYETGQPIQTLFERQVAQTPHAIAIEYRGKSITFDQLNRKANQLAAHLIQQGTKPGSLVGLYVTHSIEMIVAVLGALKSGCGYVPLDPSHPLSRTGFLVKDAGISTVLTQEQFLEKLVPISGQKLSLDSQWPLVAQQKDENVSVQATAHDIAYVIYTSGSTGEPKGVEIEHSSLANYILWAKDVYLRGEPLAFALYSSFAFDLTVTSIFTPLLTGNRIIVYPDGGLEHPLVDVLRENRVGVLKVTPSHLAMVKDRLLQADKIQRLIVGGEALTRELAIEIQPMFARNVEIFNEYGPTEATVGCMIHRFDPASDLRPYVPIGKPAANTQIYILDEKLNPTAENVIGEIYIAGDGLARGYLNRVQLTAERFQENPFAPGKKAYKTGDLARWLPNGVIEYSGRKDDQIKFHGYRIELNEIRIALNRHAQIKDSVIVIEKDPAGGDVMVAHYAADQAIDAAELRIFLLDRIIEETVPNIFVHLLELPLTANGKVDHKTLPTLQQARQTAKRVIVPPRSQTEELLAAIWLQVLGLSEIGVTDDFFEFGGHSLLAHQIISRTRATFHLEVPLRTLFEATTIEKLAEVVDRLARERGGVAVSSPVPVDRKGPLPLSFGQRRLWIMDQLRGGSVSYNIYPSFELLGPLNVNALEQSINEIVRRHESLRTTFKVVDGEPVQVIAPELHIKVPVDDISSLSPEEQESAIQTIADQQVRKPFQLAEGPLLRVYLIRTEKERHICFIAMHHIISDAASMGIFYGELAAFYKALCTRTLPKLRPPSVQYADYAAWQRQWLQGEVLENQVSYWRSQLENAPPVLDLIPSRKRPVVLSHEGTYQGISVSPEVSEKIKELSRKQRCTLFMTLLAAFNVVLQHFSGREDIVVGTDLANRNRPEIEGLIGFFVNSLVLRTDLTGNPKFNEIMHRVREVCLGAFSHQELPFEKLVEELNPDRETGQNPLFQVLFGFINENSNLALDLPGLSLKPMVFDNKTSIFEFSLYMADTPGGLGGTAQYNTQLYDRDTITRFVKCFELLLGRVAANPDLTLAEMNAILEQFRVQDQLLKAKELSEQRRDSFNKVKRQKAEAVHA